MRCPSLGRVSRVPTTPGCMWWNRPEEDLSSGKLESAHSSRTVVKSTLAGDVHPNPGPPRYPCSDCFKNATSVHSRCLVCETSWIIVDLMNGSVPPVGRHHSHAHLPHRLIPHTHPPCQTSRSTYYSTVARQWHRQHTDGTKHLPRGAQCQSGGNSGVQAHDTIEKSQH